MKQPVTRSLSDALSKWYLESPGQNRRRAVVVVVAQHLDGIPLSALIVAKEDTAATEARAAVHP